MRLSRSLYLAVVLAGIVLPVLAQEKPGNVARVFVSFPKPGMVKEYETGRKKHMEWHRKQNDPWRWDVWQVQTGEAAGAYLSVTVGHNWKDLDAWGAKFAEADAADAAQNLGPYVGTQTNGVWIYRSEFSRPSAAKEPSKMTEVFHYFPKIGSERQFEDAIRKIHEAIQKTNWLPNQAYGWYQLANGGEHPHFVLVLPHNSWAEMAPPEVSFEAMLEKAYGRQEAEALDRSLDSSIHRVSSELLAYRPDLSYIPATK